MPPKKDPSALCSKDTDLVMTLRDELICTTCLSLPTPKVPMQQCENGHLICKDCVHKAQTYYCPTCRKRLGNIRSLIAEKVIALLPHPCHNDGCEEEFFASELEDHLKSCPYRTVMCVDIACCAKVQVNRMIEHMSKDHEAGDFVHTNSHKYKSYFIVNRTDFDRPIMWISDHLTLDGKHFFRECARTQLPPAAGGGGIWHVWVYVLGSPLDAEKYWSNISVFNPETGEEVSYSGRVNPLISTQRDKTCTDVVGLTFPDNVAKQYWKNNQVHYEVVIYAKTSVASNKSNVAATPASGKKGNVNKTGADNEETTGSANGAEDSTDDDVHDIPGERGEAAATGKKDASEDDDVKETSC